MNKHLYAPPTRGGSSGMLTRVASVAALHRAWQKVRANRGAAGIDAVSCLAFERYLSGNIEELSRNLLSGSYEPLPTRSVSIPKADGSARELAIPCVRDRVAQRAVLDEIEPLFEPRFLDSSYAFRPGRSVEMAVQRIVVARAQGRVWTAESDVFQFFPSIDHGLLMAELGQVIGDPDVLRLIRQWLDGGILAATPLSHSFPRLHAAAASAQLAVRDAAHAMVAEFSEQHLGFDIGRNDADGDADALDDVDTVPRGRRAAVRRLLEGGALLALAERASLLRLLSPQVFGLGCAALAASVVAPAAVRKIRGWTQRPLGAAQGSPISPLLSNVHLHPFDLSLGRLGHTVIRYCDDFVLLCRSKAEAIDALAAAKQALSARRLGLHPEKTRIVPPDEAVAFLGYRFLPGNRVSPPPSLSDSARASLASALRKVAGRLEE